MALTPATLRLDKKCGKSGTAKGNKCSKATTTTTTAIAVAAGLGLAAGAIALRNRNRPKATAAQRTPNVPKDPPKPPTRERRAIQNLRNQGEEMAQRIIQRNKQRTQKARTNATSPESGRTYLEKRFNRALEDTTNRGYNAKHNYVYGTTPEGQWQGFSETPGKQEIAVFLDKSGEVRFKVNEDYTKQNKNNKEGMLILSRVERMLQQSIADLTDNKRIWVSPEDGDAFDFKREKLYKRYGFKPSSDDPAIMEATVKELKARTRRSDAAISFSHPAYVAQR